MSQQNKTNKQLKELQTHWYKKLAETGFEDIEEFALKSNELRLKSYSSTTYKNTTRTFSGENKENYYRIAGHFLYDYQFENDLDKLIWQYHSEGISCRDISVLLKAKGITMSKSPIFNIVKRLKQTMLSTYGVSHE